MCINLTSLNFSYLSKLVLLVSLFFISSLVYCEPSDNKGGEKDVYARMAEKFPKAPQSKAIDKPKNKEHSLTLPKVWCGDIDDEATKNVCWQAYQSSLKYFDDGLEHRKKIFKWQHFSTKIIFLIVLILVAIGVYFAWIQFKVDMKIDEDSPNKQVEKDHSVEVSTSGIKVSSPVLGVIILTLSLVFFYLYLAFVYPITEIF